MNTIMLENPKVEISGLIDSLIDADPEVRKDARVSLIIYGKLAICPLMDALSRPNSELRLIIVEILSKIHNPAAVPTLVKVLKDQNCELRRTAAEALIGFRMHS